MTALDEMIEKAKQDYLKAKTYYVELVKIKKEIEDKKK